MSGPRLVSCLLAWLWSKSWGTIGVWLNIRSFGDEMATLGVSVPLQVCQSWLTRDWASSGAHLAPDAVESALGDKLRLDEYRRASAMRAIELTR